MALFRHLAIGSATLAVAMAFAGMAKAECAPFPKVQWWSNLSHASVKKYVEKKRKGDWYAYLDKWENQFKKLEDIYSRGGSVLVTKDKIKLSDDRLKEYVENIRQRVEVTRCLADAQTIRVGGGSGDEIALKINAWCDAKTAIFQVFNEGQPWPKTAKSPFSGSTARSPSPSVVSGSPPARGCRSRFPPRRARPARSDCGSNPPGIPGISNTTPSSTTVDLPCAWPSSIATGRWSIAANIRLDQPAGIAGAGTGCR